MLQWLYGDTRWQVRQLFQKQPENKCLKMLVIFGVGAVFFSHKFIQIQCLWINIRLLFAASISWWHKILINVKCFVQTKNGIKWRGRSLFKTARSWMTDLSHSLSYALYGVPILSKTDFPDLPQAEELPVIVPMIAQDIPSCNWLHASDALSEYTEYSMKIVWKLLKRRGLMLLT